MANLGIGVISSEHAFLNMSRVWSTDLVSTCPQITKEYTVNNQYVSYAFLSLAGSMYLPSLYSKYSMYLLFQVQPYFLYPILSQ